MQVLFAVVAAASAQLIEHPNGAVTPAETPEVIAAKNAHFAAKTHFGYHPYAFNHAYAGFPYAHGYANNYAYNHAFPYAYNHAYAGYPYAYNHAYPYFGGLVTHANGAVTPADEPAVAAAKAEHFAAKGLHAPYYAHPYTAYAHHPYAYAHAYPYAGLTAHPNGALVPVEPADVIAARTEHLAAHAA